MFGAEDRIQRDTRRSREHVNGPLSRRVNSSLIGHQSNVLLPFRRLEHIKSALFEHINSVLHRAVTRAHPPLRAQCLVISRDALPPQRIFLVRGERQGRCNLRRHLHPEPDRIPLPSGMD